MRASPPSRASSRITARPNTPARSSAPETIADLAAAMHVPAQDFAAEWSEVENLKARGGRDRYGRQFAPEQQCEPPFHAVKVTGALFHTQGGLAIDA